MGKIIIMEEKADKMVDKLEMMKDTICEMIDCFSESMEGYREYDDNDDWDDEYEVKRRRGSRGGMRRGMRSGRSGGSGSSRY